MVEITTNNDCKTLFFSFAGIYFLQISQIFRIPHEKLAHGIYIMEKKHQPRKLYPVESFKTANRKKIDPA